MSEPSSIQAMTVRHNPFDDPPPKPPSRGVIIALVIAFAMHAALGV